MAIFRKTSQNQRILEYIYFKISRKLEQFAMFCGYFCKILVFFTAHRIFCQNAHILICTDKKTRFLFALTAQKTSFVLLRSYCENLPLFIKPTFNRIDFLAASQPIFLLLYCLLIFQEQAIRRLSEKTGCTLPYALQTLFCRRIRTRSHTRQRRKYARRQCRTFCPPPSRLWIYP